MKPADLPLGTVTNMHLTRREAEVTGRRFCTSCQALRSSEGGETRRYRWICATCVSNRNTRTKSWAK